jgi:uncharacterized protein YkwD
MRRPNGLSWQRATSKSILLGTVMAATLVGCAATPPLAAIGKRTVTAPLATPTPTAIDSAAPTVTATTPAPRSTALSKVTTTATPTPRSSVVPTPRPTTTTTPTLRPSAAPTPKVITTTTPTPRPSAAPTPRPTPVPTPIPNGYSDTSAANAVFVEMNSERAQTGLRALSWSSALESSATLHNNAMASADVLSHQETGEASLGSRISAQGVSWSWAGENIGENSVMSSAGAVQLETMMFAETPPNDGHKLNIQTTSGTEVGVSVWFDEVHHILWLTEDFAN